MGRPRNAINLDDIELSARRYLPGFLYDFIAGGVDGEAGLARNRQAFERYRLLPRYLRDVSKRSLETQLFGRRYSMPFGISPTGPAQIFRRDADRFLAAAAREADIPFALSGAAGASLEDIARIAPDHAWFQLYPARDRSITHDQIRRARDAGIAALVLTVDTPVTPKRERHLRNGISVPFRPKPSHWPRLAREVLNHPAWFLRFLSSGGIETMNNWRQYAAENATPSEVMAFFFDQAFVPGKTGTLVWRDVEDIRSRWPGPLIVKGILHPADARRAVDTGADAVMLSNHGGKALDEAPAPIEMLPRIRAEVGAEIPLLVDSGVRRGSDIIKALCLGADFVFAGRPTLYGVAADGQDGARKVLSILRQETDLVMAGIGCARIAELGPEFLEEKTGC
ncbi:alpha-hydroxy acid oxidase [Paracoccus sp. SCSIO 75233]|uniref:alpha-hydroxy acid oxidase n=1 Tax=Paracoccus sp. SCSIO 75233 TaxID=3017782 RepID=UPI0022F0D2E9|nr:alpha-hydroxy acid oxidase [Paracoccus sp. SCSIO 75233]WBU52861.1 alpha-hydroxy acid oxidase [Paracoccus sp. SCSIO 75233]